MYFVFFTILKTDCSAQVLNTCVKYDGQALKNPRIIRRDKNCLCYRKWRWWVLDSGPCSPVDSC